MTRNQLLGYILLYGALRYMQREGNDGQAIVHQLLDDLIREALGPGAACLHIFPGLIGDEQSGKRGMVTARHGDDGRLEK